MKRSREWNSIGITVVVDSFFLPPLLFSPRSVIYLFHSMSPEVPRPFITNSNSDSVLLRGPKRRIYIYIFLDKIWCIRIRVLFRRRIARFSRGNVDDFERDSFNRIFSFFFSWLNLCQFLWTNYTSTCVNWRQLYKDGKILVWSKFVLISRLIKLKIHRTSNFIDAFIKRVYK